MNWKKTFTEYLVFTRKERIGLLVIALLIAIIILLPPFLSNMTPIKPSRDDTAWIIAMKKLEQQENPKTFPDHYYNNKGKQYVDERNANKPTFPRKELFPFDPNNITADDWERLGVSRKTACTILKYLSKGGHFKKPEDLQKIYGLQADLFARLIPFVRIVAPPSIANNSRERNDTNQSKPVYFKLALTPYNPIDINLADTTAFIALPGIGSRLAARIVNFRDKLGGFYSISQVGETFGLPDSVFQRIRPWLKLGNPTLKKININTATAEELKAHPYIRWAIANPLLAYRNMHGPFSAIEDIKRIPGLTDSIYRKINIYLTVQ